MAHLLLYKEQTWRKIAMKWIEIITVRFIAKTNGQLIDELLRQLTQQKESGLPASIRFYNHSTVETDLSIHLLWETQAQPSGKSLLGQQLSYALKELGWLSYSIWVQAASQE
jgi:hypothetical protein